MFSHQTSMTSSATEEYNTGAFHSHVDLGNPHKEREIKRICNSEPFLKPILSLKKVPFIPHKIFSSSKFKKPQNDSPEKESKNFLRGLATELYRVLQLPLLKQWVRSEQMSGKAGGLQIPRKVWKNITRPSAEVILDPNTANPTLKLSVDRRSVRTKTHKEFHSNQSFHEYQKNDKHQYNGWMCVQAQEGYSTGRHYWEVDVKGKCDWRVGVVKESAPHNGFIKLNTAAGYWTLCLQLGSLMALTEPVTKLNQAPPSKIGVHLDLEGSQVSFYDAMKRKNIYTFNAEFRKCEKIYPVFGTVETDKPLKII